LNTPVALKNVTVTAPTGANLNFSARNIVASGNLVIVDTASPAAPAQSVNGVLTASVTNSSFASIAITQIGGGPDSSSVTLLNDVAPTGVAVSLGNANGNRITLGINHFGPTTLIEGNGGPSNANSLGNGDTVTVSGGGYQSLSVNQLLNGTHDRILIQGIVVSPTNPTASKTVARVANIMGNGVWTKQGNGAGASTTISGVTVSPSSPPVKLPLPSGTGWSNITVVQGNGSIGLVRVASGAVNDTASVTSSIVPGWISTTQADLASNTSMYNTANISNSKAGAYISITQGNAGGSVFNNLVTPGDKAMVSKTTSGGNTIITQGSGSNDSATVGTAIVGGNLAITQKDVAVNPAGDYAKVTNSTVTGFATLTQGNASGDSASIDPTTVGGNATIIQGSGSGDSASLQGGSVGGNAAIIQADLASNAAGDYASIESLSVGGSATIKQGNALEDFALIQDATIGRNIAVSQGHGNFDTVEIYDVVATGGNTAAVPSISISIVQGKGSGDIADIENITALGGNLTISQGDVAGGLGDVASVIDVVIGTTTPGPNRPTYLNGTVTITQHNAPGDIALVQGGSSNNIAITQGDAVQVLNGSAIASDIAEVNDTSVTSDIKIIQGTGTSTAAGSGNYVAAIGLDYMGFFHYDDFKSGSVTAGGSTLIQQAYANNQLYLGYANAAGGSSFTTGFLDVYTGKGGGARVDAANTKVIRGHLRIFGAYTIEGGGSRNTYHNGGGNSGMTADPVDFNS
jgi:hypothetical protein